VLDVLLTPLAGLETRDPAKVHVIERLEVVQAVVALIVLGLGVWMPRGEQTKV